MSGVLHLEVRAEEDGMRLDRWFRSHFPALGHGALQKLLRSGQVRVDGGRAKANARIAEGQTIRVPPLDTTGKGPDKPAAPAVDEADAQALRSAVIHRDRAMLVLNKPPGLAVQGGTGTRRHIDGMLDALRFDAPERPRLVHRLDRDTSGVLVLARTRDAARKLTASFKARATRKIYWALVHGVPRPARGTVDLPLVKAGRAGDQRMRPAAAGDEDAVSAVTEFSVVDHAGKRFAWLALSPLTGRTHQLRVHCAEMAVPVYGDRKYGPRDAEAVTGLDERLHLHARSIAIEHPDGGTLDLSADLPAHMGRAWAYFGFDVRDARAVDPFGDEE